MYYHGAIPVDYYYLVNRVLLLKEVMVRSVVDKFLFKVWKSPQEIISGSRLIVHFAGARDQACVGGVSLHTRNCGLFGRATESRANFGEKCSTASAVRFKSNNVQGVSPGGVYEAQFGDHNYQVLWKVKRYSCPYHITK